MRQSEQCYVLYSQTVQRNASRQQRWRGTKEAVYKGEADGVTVWRGKGWVGRVEVKGIHSTYVLFSSHILYTHTHRGRILFKRAVLKLYSCPCALSFTYAVDGWMEDRAKCFHLSASILRSVRKDLLDQRERERESRKKSSRFHSFQGCLQCCSLRGANETKVKRILRVDFFSDLSQRVFCFATCWSGFSNPSIETCVLQEPF